MSPSSVVLSNQAMVSTSLLDDGLLWSVTPTLLLVLFPHFILLFSLFIVKLPLPSSSAMLSTIDVAKVLSEIVIDSLNQE